ncbi:MAG: hypothetical protein KGL39_31335 [Patescibacteria group bacterium]|nr:hypothetical protein [Patescibacteria group bacterium]
MSDAIDREQEDAEIVFRRDGRPLDADEIRLLRKYLRKTDPDDLADIQEEWKRYKWLWGLILVISGWAAAVIGFVWMFKDSIVRGIKAAAKTP